MNNFLLVLLLIGLFEAAVCAKDRKSPMALPNSELDAVREICNEDAFTCIRAVFRFLNTPIRLQPTPPVYVQKIATPYNVTAPLTAKPRSAPYGHLLHEMSFVVVNAHVTQELHEAVVSCMSNATRVTVGRRWGLHDVNQFAEGHFQVQYHAFVRDGIAWRFRSNVNKYMSERKLTSCVRERGASMNEGSKIVYGLKVRAAIPKYLRAAVGSSRWVRIMILGLVVYNVALLCTFLLFRRRRMFIAKRLDLECSWATLVCETMEEMKMDRVELDNTAESMRDEFSVVCHY